MRRSAIVVLAGSFVLGACRANSEEMTLTPTPAANAPMVTPTVGVAEAGVISAPADQTTLTYQVDVETDDVAVAPSPSHGLPSSAPSPTPYNGHHGDPAAVQSSHQYATAVASPDGQKVIYLRNNATTVKGLDTELVLANADGSDPRDLTSTPENEYDPLYWTSDSSEVVFWRDTIPADQPGRTSSNSELIKKNIASGVESSIAPGVLVGAQALAWMPTGDRFAALASYGGANSIVLVDALDGTTRRLAVLANQPQLRVGNLRWDTGGRHLLVDASGDQSCAVCGPE